ncbi:tyrosine protein phosphatase [Capsulimonas corticalis]|uniref:protein-tyrosine-phosphatase n=1 Tax=Capsulimonas corticalis TaxID=2219043 RepID=A0A402CSY9_9BACT|nr:CpsB/CapC family capsule biosynthesis tyrosine phosphatase [Capsulimonas corticalis]BDI30923.1 tyrosine protein phosphatase [Capsulimonas corticalis]
MFVDIHNHILPGIDDGAPTLPYALDMARVAVADGTDTMVATPHRAWSSRKNAPPEWVRENVEELQFALDYAQIPLRIVAATELQVGPALARDLTEGTVLTIGGGEWALIELPFDRLPHDALDHLKSVLDIGVKIVIAHPERNADIQRHLAFVDACADLGTYFQLNTGSILGRFGSSARKAAEAILARAHELPLIIASDSHNLDHRPPNLMREAHAIAARIAGAEAADAMVNTRPRSLLPKV